MPKKKRYFNYLCKECEIDFVVSFKGKANCPKCADNVYVEYKGNIWLERSFNYKRPWTDEEDSILIDGIKLGYKHREIAESIDRTTKAVTRRVSQLKKGRDW